MRGIFVDLRNELEDLEREVRMLPASIQIVEAEVNEHEPAFDWLIVQGLASGLEKIYSGCERIMAKIASEFDESRIERYEGWHVSLLNRMAHPFPDRRSAVISDLTFNGLNRMRSFRHRERNIYGHVLDRSLVLRQAYETCLTFELFKEDILKFTDT